MSSSDTIHYGAFRLVKKKNSRFWYVRADAAPRKPLYESTGKDNQTLALKEAKRMYAEWSNDDKKFEPGQTLFREVWERLVEDTAAFAKGTTLKRMISVGENQLLPAFGQRFLEEIADHWPRYVRAQRANRPNSSLFNEKKYLMKALRYAYAKDLLVKVPQLPSVKGSKKAMRIYTNHEMQRFLTACIDNLELRLFLRFGFFMGMRAGEIAKLQVSDFDLKEGTVAIRQTKTNLDRTIAVNEAVLEDLKSQLEIVGSTSRFLFPQVHNPGAHKDQRVFDKEWQKLKRSLSIQGHFHDFRHTCANRLKTSNVPPAVAASYLGMSLRMYDAVYGRLGTQDTKAASTVVRLPEESEVTLE